MTYLELPEINPLWCRQSHLGGPCECVRDDIELLRRIDGANLPCWMSPLWVCRQSNYLELL